VLWSWVALFLSLASSGALANTSDVRIGVLGFFHPSELTLGAQDGDAIIVNAAGQNIFLQPRSPRETLHIRASGDIVLLDFGGKQICAKEIHATGRELDATNFVLDVPGKLQRRYRGTLNIKVVAGELVPVVTMDLEAAVASVVYAESLAGTPLEALKVQAVATRSYLVAGRGRHANFDFCDLTHCQVLHEAPPRGSAVLLAVAATQGLIVTYNEAPVATMFTRSCSGRTLTPAAIGISSRDYPYFSVLCDFCHQHPVCWRRLVSREDAAILFGHRESARLAVDRRLGWNAVPSNNFTQTDHGSDVALDGEGQGHGIGLCQRGARAMAQEGADFRTIIEHYFPNTKLEQVSQGDNTSQIWGVSATDPWTFTAVVALVSFSCIGACVVSARRAARLGPLVALRYE
jgi:stage II sporulation protein D